MRLHAMWMQCINICDFNYYFKSYQILCKRAIYFPFKISNIHSYFSLIDLRNDQIRRCADAMQIDIQFAFFVNFSINDVLYLGFGLNAFPWSLKTTSIVTLFLTLLKSIAIERIAFYFTNYMELQVLFGYIE